MATTYIVLNLVFLAVVCAALIARRALKLSRPVLLTFIILVVFTIVFDSFIVSSGIVLYDTSNTLGLTIGSAPIEDFFYSLLACIVVPSIWSYRRKASRAE